MDTDKGELLLALTKIGCNGPVYEDMGICANVTIFGGSMKLLQSIIPQWPEIGTCKPEWPIEGDCFKYSADFKGKWDVNTIYGARRYRLLAWLIYTLTKELYDSNRAS